MIRLAALLLLAGCATQAPKPAALTIPADLTWCPHGAPVPPAPRVPRTVEQVGAYAVRLNLALTAAEKARAVCAGRLARLNAVLDGNEE